MTEGKEMTSLYQTFSTDENLEQSGILLSYGDIRIRIARAGGRNHRFRKLLQTRLKPYRRQMDTDTMAEETSEQILLGVYAETVILGWETRVVADDGTETWEPWIEGRDGERLDFTRDNCIRVLGDLPELFRDIRSMADKATNFKQEEEEEDVKN
jgi:hypothetical protein